VSLRVVAVCAALVGVMGSMPAATAQTAVRISDVEVAEQMEEVQQVLNRFIGGLREPQAALARAGQGNADLTSALDGLKASASRMAAAYRPPARCATEDVARVLAQAKALDARRAFASESSASQARWGVVTQTLARLGQAYHIDWREAPAAWAPRRVSDRELRLAATSLDVAARDLDEMLGTTLERDMVMDRTERTRAAQLLKGLSTAVHDLLKRFEHHDDLSVALPRTVRAAAGLKPLMATYVGALPLQPKWESVNLALETIVQGFGM
jgi:hypothetical protein